MLNAADFSFECVGCELIILPVEQSIKTTWASLVRINTISRGDAPSVSLSDFSSRLWWGGNVLTDRDVTGDLELDTMSVIHKTEAELVSSTATCNR